jgi:hypothetical protein
MYYSLDFKTRLRLPPLKQLSSRQGAVGHAVLTRVSRRNLLSRIPDRPSRGSFEGIRDKLRVHLQTQDNSGVFDMYEVPRGTLISKLSFTGYVVSNITGVGICAQHV